MMRIRLPLFALALFVIVSAAGAARAQDAAALPGLPAVLTGAELQRVMPAGFFYAGRSALTQMRNAAAARIARNHLVLAGMVDTSGYSTDVQAKYQGFFITDGFISFQDGSVLGQGAYGFGFTGGNFLITDIAGNTLLSIPATTDRPAIGTTGTLTPIQPGQIQGLRPRPLMMVKAANGVRLYSGREFVEFGRRTEPEL